MRNEFGQVVKEKSFIVISLVSSGAQFVQWSIIICAMLEEVIMKNISVKLY